MNYNNWYLIRAWKQSKILFVAIVIFLSFQLFFSIKRIQNFPFFTYDMYSRKIEKPITFSLYEVKINNKTINHIRFTNLKESILLSQIKAYEQQKNHYPKFVYQKILEDRFKNKISTNSYQFIQDGLTNDVQLNKEFPNWFNNQFLQTKDSFTIEQKTYRFDDKQCIDTKKIVSNHEM